MEQANLPAATENATERKSSHAGVNPAQQKLIDQFETARQIANDHYVWPSWN